MEPIDNCWLADFIFLFFLCSINQNRMLNRGTELTYLVINYLTTCIQNSYFGCINKFPSHLFSQGGLHSSSRCSQLSLGSTAGDGGSSNLKGCMSMQVATYKGRVVAVKTVARRHVDINRNLKKELKRVCYSCNGTVILNFFFIVQAIIVKFTHRV